jgi:flagellar basal-body rod protein FlgB
MIGNLDDAFRFSANSLRLRAERQQLLASNIANADTPNYKARDIDFKQALDVAMSGGPAGLATTSDAHIGQPSPSSESFAGVPLLYRRPTQGSVDGNTVEMDVERTQFADNAVRYEAGVTMLNAQIRSLMAAIQG